MQKCELKLFSKRSIATSNLQIHELHCQKHLLVCQKCGEAIPKSATEEHDEEYHKEVECDLCHGFLPVDQLVKHKVNSTITASLCYAGRFCFLILILPWSNTPLFYALLFYITCTTHQFLSISIHTQLKVLNCL